jgi:uncharacterized protein with FMN-binding domain
MLDTYEQHSKRKLAATILSIVVIAGIVLFADQLRSTSPNTISKVVQTTPTTQTSTVPSSTSSNATSNNYKDGAYTASSSYYVPHGSESIQVNLTVSNGVVTAASITNSESDPTSATYQEDFAATYKSQVVGQKIAGLQLGSIAGASDTTQGFNDALSQIAAKAQA